MRGIESLINDSERQKAPEMEDSKPTSIEDVMTKMADLMDMLTTMSMSKSEKYEQEVNNENVEVPPVDEPPTDENKGDE